MPRRHNLEIVDHILSFLDETSLKACLVAHPAFSSLVERHLYSHITVSTIDYGPSELARMLSDNPTRRKLSPWPVCDQYCFDLLRGPMARYDGFDIAKIQKLAKSNTSVRRLWWEWK